jgi:hypothetical protein
MFKIHNQQHLKTRAFVIDKLFQGSNDARMEDKSTVYQAISMMDRYLNKNYYKLADNFEQDCFLVGYTCLFMASKNQEVDPLSIKDVRKFFMQNVWTRREILEMESDIRNAIVYENEVSTLFDFLMLFSKIWKIDCQKTFVHNQIKPCASTYRFLNDIENMVYDLSKSVLTDITFSKYSLAVVVSALYTVALETQLKLISDDKIDKKPKDGLPVLDQLKVCNMIWDSFVTSLFGKDFGVHL